MLGVQSAVSGILENQHEQVEMSDTQPVPLVHRLFGGSISSSTDAEDQNFVAEFPPTTPEPNEMTERDVGIAPPLEMSPANSPSKTPGGNNSPAMHENVDDECQNEESPVRVFPKNWESFLK